MSAKPEIRNTFIDMVKSGNSKITVNSICENMNISRKTFYKYYKDKYDIIEDIVHSDYSTHKSFVYTSQNHVEDSVAVLNSLYSKLYFNKEFYIGLLKYDKEYIHMLECLYKENYRMNEMVFVNLGFKYRSKTELEYHMYLAAMSGMNLTDRWIREKFAIPSREVAEMFFNFVVSSWY